MLNALLFHIASPSIRLPSHCPLLVLSQSSASQFLSLAPIADITASTAQASIRKKPSMYWYRADGLRGDYSVWLIPELKESAPTIQNGAASPVLRLTTIHAGLQEASRGRCSSHSNKSDDTRLISKRASL